MPSTRSKSIANNTAALADHGILCRVRKLEGTVSRLQRMMRNNGCSQNGIDGANGRDGAPGADGANGRDGAPGADGANGRDGAPGADGANGRDGAPGADGANGRDGAPGADGANGRGVKNGQDNTSGVDRTNGRDGSSCEKEADCFVVGHPGQAAGHLEEAGCSLLGSELNVPSHRIVVVVMGPSASGVSFSFSMRRNNTFTPLKRYVLAKLGMGRAFNLSLAHQGQRISSSACTPETLGVSASQQKMVLTFAVN